MTDTEDARRYTAWAVRSERTGRTRWYVRDWTTRTNVGGPLTEANARREARAAEFLFRHEGERGGNAGHSRVDEPS